MMLRRIVLQVQEVKVDKTATNFAHGSVDSEIPIPRGLKDGIGPEAKMISPSSDPIIRFISGHSLYGTSRFDRARAIVLDMIK